MNGRISVDALMVDCVIGCHDAERTTPQTIQVDLWIELDIEQAAASDSLSMTWDYCALSQQLMFILQSGRFHLLESAGRMLLRHLLLPPAPDERRPAVAAASVSLTKFGVLPGQATPRLTLTARADAQRWQTEEHGWGQQWVIDESLHLRLYRRTPARGAQVPMPSARSCLAIAGSESVLCTERLRGGALASGDAPL